MREPSMRINLKRRFTGMRAKRVDRSQHSTKWHTYRYSKIGKGISVPMAYARSVRDITKRQQNIMRELAAEGVNVERIIGISGNKVMTEHMGRDITGLMHSMARAEKLQALTSAAEQLGKMNALGYEHGHAHLWNFTWDRREAAIIDFSMARRAAPGSRGDMDSLMGSIIWFESEKRKVLATQGKLLQHADYEAILRTYAEQFPKAIARKIYPAILRKREIRIGLSRLGLKRR